MCPFMGLGMALPVGGCGEDTEEVKGSQPWGDTGWWSGRVGLWVHTTQESSREPAEASS